MADDLTDEQIDLLCEIEESDSTPLTDRQKRDLDVLLSAGFVEHKDNHRGLDFRLTAKAIEFLGQRGVGLNEG
jgi:hypothetical protein